MVDTSAWVESTRLGGQAIKAELNFLLAEDDVATTEFVIGELLQGSRTETEFADWFDKMNALHYFAADRHVWERAERLSYELARQGLRTNLSDLVIATVALDNDLSVYAIDSDFARVPGLKLHQAVTLRGRDQPQTVVIG